MPLREDTVEIQTETGNVLANAFAVLFSSNIVYIGIFT